EVLAVVTQNVDNPAVIVDTGDEDVVNLGEASERLPPLDVELVEVEGDVVALTDDVAYPVDDVSPVGTDPGAVELDHLEPGRGGVVVEVEAERDIVRARRCVIGGLDVVAEDPVLAFRPGAE